MIKEIKPKLSKLSKKSSQTKVQSTNNTSTKPKIIEKKTNPKKATKKDKSKQLANTKTSTVIPAKTIKNKSKTIDKSKTIVKNKKTDTQELSLKRKIDNKNSLTKSNKVKKNNVLSDTKFTKKIKETIVPPRTVEKKEFISQQQHHSQILVNLFSDYYLNATSNDNIPAPLELENAEKLLIMIINKDLRIKQKKSIDSSSLITYLKPIFDEFGIEFPQDFYVKFRLIVQNMNNNGDPQLLEDFVEFTRAIENLSLNGTPCRK